MAGIARVHGQTTTGAFYGYTPLVVKVTAAGKFTADSVNGTTGAITDGGYTKARRILQTFASIVWLGDRASGTFVAIVDQPTANQGDGAGGNAGATTGFGALSAALAAGISGSAGDYVVTTSSTLNGDGSFTFA
jgi:hypothetical protein